MNLVTGGSGLIGTHLMLELLKSGQEVKALRRKHSDLEMVKSVFRFWEQELLFDQIIWVEGDVLDIDSLLEAMKDCSTVYHCAAMVSFHPRDFEMLAKVNVEGTSNVVNVCLAAGINQLCYISSIAAIGRSSDGEQIFETNEWKNSSMNTKYALSKRDSELEVWRGSEEGLNVVIVNPGLVIGPGDITKSSSKIFQEVKNGLNFYSTGVNGFVDVRDVAESMLELVKLEKWGERYILVGENRSFKDVFELIAEAYEKPHAKYELKQWMASLGGFLFWLKDRVLRTKSAITKESVRNINKKFYYQSGKIEKTLNRQLRPIAPIVEMATRYSQHRG